MQIIRQKFWLKATTWLLAEIFLNLLGIDELADYSEFIFDPGVIVGSRAQQVALICRMMR
ncbi:MAG: hypothetical protein F6K19_37135 [Cyanothece sp. SIO1E1]|nr:hypothetical protein [Cyanothece sp. SIO1E1]